MSNLEFTFDEHIFDLFPECRQSGFLSATRFLTAMEDKPETAVEDALLELESSGVVLDISDLPKVAGTGEAALRLRREAELVKNRMLPQALEENDPLRLYLEEIASIPATVPSCLPESDPAVARRYRSALWPFQSHGSS